MATKLNIENLMPGGEAWWHQQSAVNHPERAVAPTTVQAPDDVKRQQLADMRQPNPQMPTRTRDGGYRQPGVSENELNDFMAQGDGEVVDLTGPNEMNKSQAQKIGEQRAAGVLPEQNTKKVADRHQRTAIEVNDEGGSAASTQGTGATYNGYDDILKLMSHNAVSDAELARRQRSREIVAGLGDTISAIANMWATTKGAPNSYDNSKGMSATAQERYAKMLAERKAQQEQILNYYRVKRQAELEKENQEYRSAVAQSRKDQLEEQQRHNKELEKIAAGKAETDKENKERTAAEKERSNKANEEERNRHNKAVENKKSQGKTGGSSKRKKGKTHTGRKGKVYGSGKGKKRLY